MTDSSKTIHKSKKMKEQDYTTSITVDATAHEAYHAINDVRGWWSEDFEGAVNKPGDVFTVRFGKTFITMRVEELIPGRTIVWLVTDSYKHWMKSNNTEWVGTTIRFEIAEKGTQRQIHFMHQGLIPELDCFDACSNAWGQYIQGSLLNLVMAGKGQPTVN